MPKIWVDRTTLNGEEKEDGLKAITLASHDHKDLVQIWLIKNPDLSGKSRISTAFKLSLTNQQPDLLRKAGTSRQLDPSRGYKS